MAINGLINAHRLGKSYSHRPVLDGLDFTIERGSAVGLLGANGAGKTTLLKCILGLLPIDAGRCEILGDSSSSISSGTRERVAYVPQSPALFPWLTGKAMLRYISVFFPGFDWTYANELADRWKLALHSPIGVLSPGQQQRLSIVRALATRPEILILDEPIASLDPATRLAVIDELIHERDRRPLTVLFSSHLIGDLERLCSHFAVLRDGKIAVMRDVEWFRRLVRVTLESEEDQLGSLSVPGAALVRKSGEGRRIVVMDSSEVSSLKNALSDRVQLSVDKPNVEALSAEWMQ